MYSASSSTKHLLCHCLACLATVLPQPWCGSEMGPEPRNPDPWRRRVTLYVSLHEGVPPGAN